MFRLPLGFGPRAAVLDAEAFGGYFALSEREKSTVMARRILPTSREFSRSIFSCLEVRVLDT